MIKAICARLVPLEGEAWKTLTQSQIATRCRARAESAIALAEDDVDSCVPYLETAEAWMHLADDIAWAVEKTALDHRRSAVGAARQLGKVT